MWFSHLLIGRGFIYLIKLLAVSNGTVFCLVGLGIEPRDLHMIAKCSTIELYPLPQDMCIYFRLFIYLFLHVIETT